MAKAKKERCGWVTVGRGWPCLLDEHEKGDAPCVMPDLGLDIALVLAAARKSHFDGPFLLPWAQDRLGRAIEHLQRLTPLCGAPWDKDPTIKCSLLAGHDVKKAHESDYVSPHCFRDGDTKIEWPSAAQSADQGDGRS